MEAESFYRLHVAILLTSHTDCILKHQTGESIVATRWFSHLACGLDSTVYSVSGLNL
jgi:hypothetical protein